MEIIEPGRHHSCRRPSPRVLTFADDAFPDRLFSAAVSKVHFGARTVSGVVTYETVLTLDNSSLNLRPGMTATANIVVNRVQDAVLVPNAALRFSPAGSEPTQTAASGRGLVERLMPHLPARRPTQRAPAQSGARQLWILQADRPVAVDVQTGATDGVNTQIVSGDIRPGMAVIVDAAAREMSAPGTSAPAEPPLIRPAATSGDR